MTEKADSTAAAARADVPLYLWLAARLAERIKSGPLTPGDALPAERKIAERYGVSRVTVRRAMEELVTEGLIDQRQGAGTFVSRRLQQPLSILTSFSEDVRARGMAPESVFLNRSTGIASPEEAIGLGLKPGEPVSRVSRLRKADGMPLAVENATLVRTALPEPETVTDSLYQALERTGCRPVRAVQRLSAVAADARTAALLEVPVGSPGLSTLRVGYLPDGRAIEYTRSTYRGDRWDFITELA